MRNKLFGGLKDKKERVGRRRKGVEWKRRGKEGIKSRVESRIENKRFKRRDRGLKEVNESEGVIGYFKAICQKYQYRNYFTYREKKEAKEITSINRINKGEILRRKDFREEVVITIDGEDAKDLDDGVSIKKEEFGYELGIHIADVSHYIKEDTVLDKEASRRGNSVYLGNQVIPMLPKELSNGVCSLNELEERLTLSVVVRVDEEGEVLWYNFYEGVIEVKHRFNYKQVEELLEKEGFDFVGGYEVILKQMWFVANKLYQNRMKEGGLDFNIEEIKIVMGEVFPIDVKKEKRLKSHRIIEELMLMANKLVAEKIDQDGIGIYRVHGKPEKEKLESFVKFARRNGCDLPLKVKAKDCQKILNEIHGKEQERLLNIALLRSMKQAIYTTKNEGHFGLSLKVYTHFTSPIRRYADLMVHRMLKKMMEGGIKERIEGGQRFRRSKKEKFKEKFLERATKHLSSTERTAIEAEREIEKTLMARFMKDKVGMEFEGEVSGVMDFGFFVEIYPHGVEGLVKVSSLKGYYIYDDDLQCLYHRSKKWRYEIGKKVKVILVRVEVEKGFIDLEIENNKG